MKTKVFAIVVGSFLSLQSFAAPVAGCYELNPPGFWSELLQNGANGAVGNEIAAWDDATYSFTGATLAEVQADLTGEWDWITRYEGGVLVLSNVVDSPWFWPCEGAADTAIPFTEVIVKTRSSRFTNEAGRLEFEISGASGPFAFAASYAGVPTAAIVETNVLVGASLASAEICIGERTRMNVVQSTINLSSRGVLPVVLYGSADVDVRNIDFDSIKLECAPALRGHIVDMNRDGYKDMLLKFSTPQVAPTLMDVTDKTVATLVLTAALEDGTPIAAMDTARILNKHKPAKPQKPQKPAKSAKPAKPGKK